NELIILTVPAYAQDVYLEQVARHARDDTMVLIQPGKFGALRLVNLLRQQQRVPSALLIGETSTFLYAAKMHGLDRIWLRGVKKELPLAAWPASRTQEMLDRLHTVNHQYVPAQNVFATSIDDVSYAIHPVTTLLNLSRLEVMGPYRTDCYDITPQVSRMVEAVDDERCRIAAAFDIHVSPFLEQAKSMYGMQGDSVYEAMQQTTVHRNQMTPHGADHRYVTEEVPFGLVPLLELAKVAGVHVPAIQAIVTTASLVNATDYEREGRHLDALGFGSMSVADILQRL
ncbi:MAG TPA: NAD/NADP octopine/nopaline dehydrogenase family protein, partial [Orrella sp.]